MRIWRISNHADLSGIGGRVAAARWNPLQTLIVYCADHPASALLEVLVHIDFEDAPRTYQLLGIDVPELVEVHEPDLPTDWASDFAFTQGVGLRFIASAVAPVMRVPSVVVPFAWNYLLNPEKLAAAKVHIASITTHPIDPRLLA